MTRLPENKLTVYSSSSQDVAEAMVAAGAYRIDTEHFFTWKSGIKAPVYTDSRTLMANPDATDLIKKELGKAVLEHYDQPDYIIGIAEAGVFWSGLVANEIRTPHSFVRKQEKAHGIGRFIAGLPVDFDPNQHHSAVIVDDLVASAGSLTRSVEALRDEGGFDVRGVASIVNWDFPAMHRTIRTLGIEALSLVSYPDMLQASLEQGKIDDSFRDELLQFYQNPSGHQWSPAYTAGLEA